jgi:hypothetical protein
LTAQDILIDRYPFTLRCQLCEKYFHEINEVVYFFVSFFPSLGCNSLWHCNYSTGVVTTALQNLQIYKTYESAKVSLSFFLFLFLSPQTYE